MTICNNCNTNLVPSYRKTLCDECAEMKQSAYDAKQNQPIPAQPVPVNAPVEKPGEIKPPTGEYQSLVYNKTLAANSYEVGKVGDRFKLYFETPEELVAKIAELKRHGFMQNETLEPLDVPR